MNELLQGFRTQKDHFKRQHELITLTCAQMTEQIRAKSWGGARASLKILNSMVEEHHLIENGFYVSLRDFQGLQSGGPFCTYYYDFFMNHRPMSEVNRCINILKSSVEKHQEAVVPEDLALVLNSPSMIAIPLEEHVAASALLKELNRQLIDDAPWSKSILDCVEYLISLLRTNIEKEETCLWSILNGAHK